MRYLKQVQKYEEMLKHTLLPTKKRMLPRQIKLFFLLTITICINIFIYICIRNIPERLLKASLFRVL